MDMIVKIKFGSHLYGTNTPTSDLDYKSVYVPEGDDILLQCVQHSIRFGGRTKQEGERNTADDVDNECYSLQYYLQLLSEGQTGAIDMLFAPEPELSSPVWRYIQQNKARLLTKKSAAFVGYCRTQANKYGIKGSRVAAAKAAYDKFAGLLSEYGPGVKVRDFFGENDEVFDEFTRTLRKETTQGRIERYFECCNRMVGFNNTLKEASNIYRRIHEAYGDRARLAQANEGIDWKALSHAVRVGMEALELLQTGNITFPLPYAPHILDIKQGKLSYTEVAAEIERLLEAVELAAGSSALRTEPDNEFIDALVAGTYRIKVEGHNGVGFNPDSCHHGNDSMLCGQCEAEKRPEQPRIVNRCLYGPVYGGAFDILHCRQPEPIWTHLQDKCTNYEEAVRLVCVLRDLLLLVDNRRHASATDFIRRAKYEDALQIIFGLRINTSEPYRGYFY